jgi:uncharacterized protein YjdB
MANAVFRGERVFKVLAAALPLASLIAILAGCGGTPRAYQTVSGTHHSLSSLVISPVNPVVAMGDSEHFVATGIYADGTKQDLSSTVTWASASPEIAPIDKSGMAVAKKSGSTLITAASGSISAGATLTIPPPTLVSINIMTPSLSIPKGNTEQLSAIANYLDGTTLDVTSTVTWASSAPGVVVANGTGVIAGATLGTATITASFGNIRGAQLITVVPPMLISLAIVPPNPSMAKGGTQQLGVTGTFSDASLQDVTGSAVWTVSPAAIATISSTGLISTLSAGSAVITATSGSGSASTNLTVLPATLASLSITPSNPSLTIGSTKQLTATGTFSDGTTQNLTNSVSWSASSATVALSKTGIVNAIANGTATVTATSGSVSASATIAISGTSLTSIAISPPNPSMVKGATQQLIATGTLSDGTTQNLTGSVTWVSSPGNIVTVNAGLASATAVGTTTVTATSGTISGSDTITVSVPSLVSIAVSPSNPAVINGKSKQLTAMATYSDASTQDITGSASWSTSSPSVVNVSGSGLVTGQAPGVAPVKATSGTVSGSAIITVSPVTLVSIAIVPPNPSIPKGETQLLAATGTYNDGSTQDITNQVSWSNSAPNIVGLSGSDPVNITAENLGAATLTATSGSISASTNVTVSAPVAVALSVVPANPSVAVGITQQLSAVETFSDGTTQRLTNLITWTSENPDIATVDNSGLVTGQAEGMATIAASYLLLNSSATLTVTPFNYLLTESRATSNRYSYFANANVPGIDATFRITNPGATGQDLCAMVYVFAADQQMSECCGCRVTTNGLLTLSLNNDLNSNPLTGKVPASGTVEVLAADPASNPTCDPSTLAPLGELTVWATHIQNMGPVSSGDNGGGGGGGESTLAPVAPQSECAFVQSLGSGQGICTCGTEQ